MFCVRRTVLCCEVDAGVSMSENVGGVVKSVWFTILVLLFNTYSYIWAISIALASVVGPSTLIWL